MNIKTLRILSKAGLLITMIGFFMPIACNLNGFELARYASTFDSGINLLTVSLYGIFIFSCLGVILLLLIALGKQFSIKLDWISTIGAIIFSILVFTNLNSRKDNWNGNILQSGAYIIIFGITISLVSLLWVSYRMSKRSSTYELFGENDNMYVGSLDGLTYYSLKTKQSYEEERKKELLKIKTLLNKENKLGFFPYVVYIISIVFILLSFLSKNSTLFWISAGIFVLLTIVSFICSFRNHLKIWEIQKEWSKFVEQTELNQNTQNVAP